MQNPCRRRPGRGGSPVAILFLPVVQASTLPRRRPLAAVPLPGTRTPAVALTAICQLAQLPTPLLQPWDADG